MSFTNSLYLEMSKNLKIACLGWGSLVWDPQGFPIRGGWLKVGPLAGVEFTRQSSNKLITLVIDPKAAPVTLLWAHMLPSELPVAVEALRKRERTILSKIGSWQRGVAGPTYIADLPKWASDRNLDAVIWTNLEPKFRNEKGRSPSASDVIAYLRGLSGKIQNDARKYIERAPRQIDTKYRRQIEVKLGWSCKDTGQ